MNLHDINGDDVLAYLRRTHPTHTFRRDGPRDIAYQSRHTAAWDHLVNTVYDSYVRTADAWVREGRPPR